MPPSITSQLSESAGTDQVLAQRRVIARRLLRWFDRQDRNLPWLKQKSAYKIWVSEIMLQQTQLATVMEHFPNFIRRFPNVRVLAAANEADVLRAWEGLGYYRRARQLHHAARIIVDRFDGKFPTQFEAAVSLPGVGRYTAAAILSITWDQPQPILEANTVRLFSRLTFLQSDPSRSENQKLLWGFSERLLPSKRIGDFNQAIMDFGRHICRASQPDCEHCPLAEFCRAYLHRKQHAIPVHDRKVVLESLHEGIALIERNKKFLVRHCQEKERWAGLWDFPRFRLVGTDRLQSLANDIRNQTGLLVQLDSLDHAVQHGVTRYRINLEGYRATSVQGRLRSDGRFHWKSAAEVFALPLNITARKFARLFVPSSSM